MELQAMDRARTHQPCAACRTLRRRCDNNCVLAPYFAGDEIEKFIGVHKVFGASNVIKMIQMVEETKREDTVKALVYEATARLRDPVYGSTRIIFYLQKMVEELKAQLESTRAKVFEVQRQKDELLGILVSVNQLDLLSDMDDPWFYGGSLELDCDTIMAFDPPQLPTECDWIS
ncbi:hypothetical protein SLE2022_030170 [Rubroshorea leprosula]|uniref:LOB domain-containing protein n=1 Tax=Rubroshorea leprosula TaxID=152421 RepID=A0AAV5IEN5_9ROSI|nr:hypothetical protein SLEP1_g9831 [Rubroshorea leprosula]